MRSTLLVAVLWAAFGCGGSGPTPPTTPAGKIVSIQIVPTTDVLKVGECLFYSVDPAIVGVATPGPPPSWSSTNQSLATVDPSGKVTGLAPGETSIRGEFSRSQRYAPLAGSALAERYLQGRPCTPAARRMASAGEFCAAKS